MSLVGAILDLGISVAQTLDDLALFWRDHQALLKHLPAGELATLVAAKDRRKVMLQRS